MTVTDAGPLVALLDADEADHELCQAALDQLELPLLTTWPAFTEAMQLLRRAGGWTAQAALWEMHEKLDLAIADLARNQVLRAAELMHKYSDRPMSLADSTIVALAEAHNTRRVFSLDADFRIYRFRNWHPFEVIPA